MRPHFGDNHHVIDRLHEISHTLAFETLRVLVLPDGCVVMLYCCCCCRGRRARRLQVPSVDGEEERREDGVGEGAGLQVIPERLQYRKHTLCAGTAGLHQHQLLHRHPERLQS